MDPYRNNRDVFLSQVVTSLSKDERFVAAWLTGSLGRGDADSVSDIDLSLVIAEEYNSSLCSKTEAVSHQTSPERFSLVNQFGTPALIHENNHNAPEGGTFTFVLYANNAIMVDWVLIPQSKAKRTDKSKILFDKVGIPVSQGFITEDLEQRRKSVAEHWAFFWMMAAVTVKYIIRGDGVFVTQWIENLHSLIGEMERKIIGEPWKYRRGSMSQLHTTAEEQVKSLKQLCQRMQELNPQVADFIGFEPLMPMPEIETLFALVKP